jgi:hypothetical protein
LIVNPYHVEETADALHRAATMPPAEQRERMASLRSTVREFNVFRWAGRMLADAGRWRLRERIEARVRGAMALRTDWTRLAPSRTSVRLILCAISCARAARTSQRLVSWWRTRASRLPCTTGRRARGPGPWR